MSRSYQQALRATKDRQALHESQRNWIAQRDTACSAVTGNLTWSCILDATKFRAIALNKIASSNIDQGTPTQAPNVPSTIAQTRLETSAVNPSNPAQIASSSKSSTAAPNDDGSSFVTGFAILIGAFIALQLVRHTWRRRRLTKKYGSQDAAQIMAREVWQGMTAEQLTESRGRPVEIGREIIRARIKETWKYGQTGKNRFQNRVYLEDGIVIGWKI